jgi:hypothetical protein
MVVFNTMQFTSCEQIPTILRMDNIHSINNIINFQIGLNYFFITIWFWKYLY